MINLISVSISLVVMWGMFSIYIIMGIYTSLEPNKSCDGFILPIWILSMIVGCIITYYFTRTMGIKDCLLSAQKKPYFGCFLVFIGHLGPISGAIMISQMTSGNSNGIMLIPSLLWTIVFYGIGLLTVMIGVVKSLA